MEEDDMLYLLDNSWGWVIVVTIIVTPISYLVTLATGWQGNEETNLILALIAAGFYAVGAKGFNVTPRTAIVLMVIGAALIGIAGGGA